MEYAGETERTGRPGDAEATGDRAAGRIGVQVIARAAAVMRALKDDPSGLSLGQIADRVALPRSTVQRIANALQQERLVIASSQGGLRLGPELRALADAAQYDVVERCRPYLIDLIEKTGETADLSVLRGGRMIFLDQMQGTHRLRTVSSVGEVFPLTTTANGRACLAILPEAEARRMAEEEWCSRGSAAGNWPALRGVLANVRQTGLAEDLDAHTDGISALGIAFTDLAGDLHAISVPVPSTRFAEQKELVARTLLGLKAELIRVLER